MAKNKLEEVLDTAKTGFDLASNIAECADPTVKNKTSSIVGIMGNSILFGWKMQALIENTLNNINFKEHVKSTFRIIKIYVDTNNPFYQNTYDRFNGLNYDDYCQTMKELGIKILNEYPNDIRVNNVWNFLMGNGANTISETELNYGLSKLKEFDIKLIRNNNQQLDPQYVEQVLITTYNSFASDMFNFLKSELKSIGKLI